MKQEEFWKVFEYNNGKLFWKISPKYDIPIGSIAGSKTSDGYTEIGYHGKHYLRHRLIYFMHIGEWPPLIDHIDQNPTNDNIDILRASNKILNGHNTNKYTGVIPYRGVSYDKRRNVFIAYFILNRKRKYLGQFKTAEDASSAYTNYKKEVIGYVG